MQGKSSYDGKENRPVSAASNTSTSVLPTPRQVPSAFFGSLFSGARNCNITISPQNFTVNVGSTSHDASLASTSSRSISGVDDQLDLNRALMWTSFGPPEFFSVHLSFFFVVYGK